MPSPAMVVALISLVFAATGTGIAATGAITGADIQNGSITSADLATGAVTSTDIRNGTVSSTDIRNGTVSSTDIKNGSLTSTDLTAATVTQFDQVDIYRPLEGIQKIIAAKPPPLSTGAAGAAGAAGANGIDGAAGVSWNMVNADFAAGAFTVDRFYGVSGPGAGTFADAATTSPTLPGTITDAKVDLLKAPSPDGLTLIDVTLFTSIGTPAATAASCVFNPSTATGCTIPGKVAVPAGARVAWRVRAVDGGVTPAFDAFKVGLAYTITTGP